MRIFLIKGKFCKELNRVFNMLFKKLAHPCKTIKKQQSVNTFLVSFSCIKMHVRDFHGVLNDSDPVYGLYCPLFSDFWFRNGNLCFMAAGKEIIRSLAYHTLDFFEEILE